MNINQVNQNSDPTENQSNTTNSQCNQSFNKHDTISDNNDLTNNNQPNLDVNINNIPRNYPNNIPDHQEIIPDDNKNINISKNINSSTYHPTQNPIHLDQPDDNLDIDSPKHEELKSYQSKSSFKTTTNNQQIPLSKKSDKSSTQNDKIKFRQLILSKECTVFRFKFKNYHNCRDENGFTIYKKNLSPIIRHLTIPSRSHSEGLKKTEANSMFSKSLPPREFQSKNLTDITKINNLKKQFLSHLYKIKTVPKSFNKDLCLLLLNQVSCYMKNLNIALAYFKGFSITNEEKRFFPSFLTERPVNGPLLSVFEIMKKNQSADQSGNESSKENIIDNSNTFNINNLKSISPDQKFAIICGITDGIAFIHENKFIHLYLNPTTIYLNEFLFPKICDYILIPSYNVTNTGTEEQPDFKYFFDKVPEPGSFQYPLYIAPEIFNENEELGPANDIYSLGLLIFYILTEEEPTLNNGKINYPDNFGNEWKDLIDRCILYDKTARPTANSILRELFDEDKMNKFISTIPSNEVNPEVSQKNMNYFKLLKKSIDDHFDFQCNDFSIFKIMIPNSDDIDNDTEMIILAAEKGDPKCTKKVGDFFFYGQNNILRDENCALTCYTKAADDGDVDSMLLTAKFNEEGIGCDMNLKEALKYYQMAFDKMDEKDPRRSETKDKLDQLPKTIEQNQTITLLDAPLSLDPYKMPDFKKLKIRVEKVPPNKGENHQQIKIIFQNTSNYTNVIMKQKRSKLDYFEYGNKQIKFSYLSNKPSELTRLKSLHLFLKPIKFDDYYPGKENSSYQVLGSGKYGKTYLVYRKSDEKPFAAKVLLGIETELEMNFFKREIITASRFNHPAIVHYEGFSEYSLTEQNKIDPKNLKPTLLMNFVPKENLEEVIDKQPLEWNDTTKLITIIGIVSGLIEMYKENIVHRDLKPGNILLNEKYEPVICDFGCARQYSSYRALNMSTQRGTPYYMAPELFFLSHDPIYKYEVDVYSFGIILYQIVANKKYNEIYPKNINSKLKLSKAKLNNYVAEIPEEIEVHQILVNLIKRCWNAMYDERPDPISIFNELVDAVNKETQLLPYAELDEVKQYINTLPKID